MKKFLSILLLCLVPFQTSLALSTSYCGAQEAVSQEAHVGHHAHSTAESNATSQDADGSQLSTPDDCGLCHLAHAGVMISSVTSTVEVQSLVAGNPPQTVVSLMRMSRPERPKWSPPV